MMKKGITDLGSGMRSGKINPEKVFKLTIFQRFLHGSPIAVVYFFPTVGQQHENVVAE